MPILYLAAGLPTVTTMIGDQRGPYLGYTSGSSRRAVCFDTHYPTEVRESSGLTPVVGSLGSGKSVLLGLSTYEATRRGIPCTILDPSGPLARLTDLPEFTGHARHINLLRAQPGTLNPYSVIASPIRAQFDLDPEVRALAHEVDRQACADELYAEATQEADNDRRVLATDVVRMLLPPMVDVLPATQLVIGDAIRAVGGRRTATLTQVIEHLDRHDDSHGKIVANHLRDVRDMAGARLFFSSGELRPRDAEEPTLLVLTMAGLTLPSRDVAREYWSTAERLTVPLLHLAAYYAARRIYGRDMGARKLIALDEVGQMIEWASGRALFTRLGRDSRKWNTCVFAASQSPSDVLGVGESIGNLFGTTFVGRIEDEPTAREALRLLRVPAGVGYEQVLAGLSPYADVGRVGAREFVMRDVEGRIEKIRVDLTHLPNLLTALNTTAAP